MLEKMLVEYIGPNLCMMFAIAFLMPVTVVACVAGMISIIKKASD